MISRPTSSRSRCWRTAPQVVVARKTMPADNLQRLDRLDEGQRGQDTASAPRAPAARRMSAACCCRTMAGVTGQFVLLSRRFALRCRTWSPARSTLWSRDPTTATRRRCARAIHQGLRGRRRTTRLPGAARRADLGRSRPAGFPGLDLECAVRAEGHAEGHHRRSSTPRRSTALADPAVRARLRQLAGQESRRASSRRRRRSARCFKADIEKWWPIIKAANIKAE